MAELDSGILFNKYSTYSSPTKNSSSCYGKQIDDVLNKILDNSYSLPDDTILDKLYLHLSQKSSRDDFINDSLLPWLSVVIKKWDNLKKNIKTFALKMAGSVASSPSGLKRMISSNLLLDFSKAGLQNPGKDVSVTLASVEMLFEAVKSYEGCVWFLKSGLWGSILEIFHSSRSIYLTRKTKEFIIKLILVLQKVELEFCWMIIDSLLAPLNIIKLTEPTPLRQEMLMSAQNFVGSPSGCCDSDDDDESSNFANFQNGVAKLQKKSVVDSEKSLAIVQFLCSLLDALLDANCSVMDLNIIFKNYNLYLWSWETLSAENHKSKLIDPLASLILYLIYSSLPRLEEKQVAEGDVIDTLKSFLFLIQILTSKWKYLTVNNICVLSQMLSSKLIPTPVYLCKDDGVTYNLRSQILFLHALPIFIFLKLARITHADVADKFADKLFTLTSMSVKRVCYQYRDTIRVCPQCCNTGELLRSSVQSLTGILKYLNKDQVVVVFQSLMHLLREFVPDEHMFLTKIVTLEPFELVQKYPNLLMDILNGIEITITNYNITWSESLETSCVMVLLTSFACISDISTPLSTKILRLIHLAISNFIPPNLALLVENIKGSSLELLGPLLLKKLHDVHWEVRDSTLEVLQTLSVLSALKFPKFQNIILELNFPSIVIGMFECDEESYVRSSAIVCLQKMVQVKRLWEEALEDEKLIEKMLKCFKTEPEGIVRKEAASLITAICVNHEVSPILMEDVYKQLVLSATADLHWEVKVSALTFWDSMIDHETANQGMIDGVFPAVTFSITSRKIVSLTPFEIQKRLKAVLELLEKCGCLQVLWAALNDTSDLEVARKSVTIIVKLIKLLQQYGVVEETCGRATVLPNLLPSGSKDDMNGDLLKKVSPGGDFSKEEEKKQNGVNKIYEWDDDLTFAAEEVMNSIMDSQDIDLLSSVYKNSEINKEEMKEGNEEKKNGSNNFITAKEFIEKVISLNLESVIKVRSDWLTASEDLDSLIEDILAVSLNTYDNTVNNINAKDCY